MSAERVVRNQYVAAKKLERAKEMRRSMTPDEETLWRRLRRNQLAGLHFRRQQVIDGFIVDFYCHAASLVVEVDGQVHGKTKEYDKERDKVLSAHGLTVLRVRAEAVQNDLRDVLNRISEAAISRSKAPLPSREGAGG